MKQDRVAWLLGFVFGILAFIPIYDSYAKHNYDPNNPVTHIDRGYNKENCEKWVTKDDYGREWKGHWLGHKVGCLMNGKIYGEFTVTEAKEL